MLHYIIQILFFQLFFLLVYEVFLKKETFFNYNRIYLIATPLLACLMPWLRLEFLVEAVPASARLIIPQVISNESGIYWETLPQVTIYGEKGLEINWWLITYLAGLLFSISLFLLKYRDLRKFLRLPAVNKEQNFRIVEIPGSNAAYTFFNTVFIGDQLSENEKENILSHELVHVKQKHSVDLIYFEILKIVLWFNPLIYIYQNRIAGLHEFIADEEVVRTTEKRTYYQQLLNTAFSTQNISFINQFFNHSLIKKRIFMLQKSKSSQLSKFKFLLVIPLMLAMLTYVACSEDSTNQNLTNNSDIDHQMDLLLESLKQKQNLTSTENVIYHNLLKRKEEGDVDQEKTILLSEVPLEKYDDKIPYALIEKVPAFPGCEEWAHDVLKNCTSDKISQFVTKNFNTDLGKELGLTGFNRVLVQFRISETGKIVDVKARAPHPELVKEAKRVISSLPDMIPGEQNGRPVSVMYSLPIAFKVSE
ncbi:M56 family metallopeptidase [Christiangramia salexigens]|uniref:BlaR1 peptidase M56 n=1 Tax=Christiangramia salexigens TaxID=1913577 RepID=A0A1L3J5T4_9FLAO|nr:M56 family metallopeptidase [Christiangramia salexigens]APG60497.1 blaR1 peptidase M56 [Christiangramia salexigens]